MGNLYVFDTSALISNPSAVKKSRRHGVIIPSAVLRQLDGLKNSGNGNTAYWARKASQAIEKQQAKGNLLILSEHMSISNLPNRADNEILGTALWIRKHYDQYCDGKPKNTILVSTDRNMRIVAKNCGLKAEGGGGAGSKGVFIAALTILCLTVSFIFAVSYFPTLEKHSQPFLGLVVGWGGIFVLLWWIRIRSASDVSYDYDDFVSNPGFRHCPGNAWYQR